MYAALMTGVANYLCENFGYSSEQVRYGGTDDFWNRFHLERVKTPGLVYGATTISFPKGLSAHGSVYLGSTNASETEGLRVHPILFTAVITLGMIADNEDDHFDQIHRYVEMGAFHARLKYRVQLPGLNTIEEWESTVGEFSELSPAPSGHETNEFDPEGKLYKLEGTFNLQSQFFVTDEYKLVRCVVVNQKTEDSVLNLKTIGYDSNHNVFPNSKGE